MGIRGANWPKPTCVAAAFLTRSANTLSIDCTCASRRFIAPRKPGARVPRERFAPVARARTWQDTQTNLPGQPGFGGRGKFGGDTMALVNDCEGERRKQFLNIEKQTAAVVGGGTVVPSGDRADRNGN